MDPAYEALSSKGADVRLDVLGSTGDTAGDEFRRSFQEVANALAWGGVWSREGLGLRDRCLLTVVALTALGITDVLPMHVRGALRHGVTEVELREALLHVALYAGFPRTSVAMKIAGDVMEERR